MNHTRDYVMARLAVALTSADGVREIVAETIGTFVEPEGDGDGAQRLEMIDTALLICHAAADSLSAARRSLSEFSDQELAASEDSISFEEDDGEEDDGEEG